MNSVTPKRIENAQCKGSEEAGSALQTIAGLYKDQNKILQELVKANTQQNKILQGIEEPNITAWIGTATNFVIALLAIYAAIKVRNVFDDKLDSKVYAEVENFWENCDEVIQDIKIYDLFIPFSLLEPKEEWSENEEVKKKVANFLDFSDNQSKKMKCFLHKIMMLERNINRLGWIIHPKALDDFNSILELAQRMYFALGTYNCLTAQLFRIDKQFIGQTMFLGLENLEWDKRFTLIDKDLSGHIREIKIIKDEITIRINNLEDLSAKRRFVSKN